MTQLSFESFLAGALAGIALAALLRVPAVATTVAIVLALAIIAFLAGGEQLGQGLPELIGARLTELASTGTLSGLVLGKSLAAVMDGLVRGARRGGSK